MAAESNSFVLLRFAEHRNEIEIGDFFSAFFFPFQKNCCAEPRIVLLVVNAAVASC